MPNTPTLWGGAVQANTTDTINDPFAGLLSGQGNAQVAAIGGGRFVVIWEDDTNTFGFGLGPKDIVGQVFDATGAKVGSEFVVNVVYADYDQSQPDIVALPGGGFAVAMKSLGDPLLEDGENIIVEIFDADGVKVSDDDFRQFPGGPDFVDDTRPSLTAVSGGYAVVYQQSDGVDEDIVGHIVSGGVIGTAFTVEGTAGTGRDPETTTLENGNFVVVYEVEAAGGATQVRAQIRTPTATLVTDFLIDSDSADDFGPVKVAALTGGRFAVAFQKENVDGNRPGILVKTYEADGSLVADTDSMTFATTVDGVTEPAIVGTPDGGFVVVWHENETGAIRGQRFYDDDEAFARGREFIVADIAGTLSSPQITVLGDGRLLISFVRDEGGGDSDVFTTIWDPRDSPITGTVGDDALTARVEGATIHGLGGNDTLYGGAGNDVLHGGRGIDRMEGDAGNDIYYVYEAGDVVVELPGHGSNDWVATGTDYRLAAGAEIEKFTTTNVGGLTAIDLTGNAFSQVIHGNAGRNWIDGGGGGDRMIGHGGNDVYIVNSDADIIVEAVNEGALDIVAVRTSYVLTTGAEIESLRTTNFGGLSPINLTGNEFGQTVYGNAGNNVINGGSGNDTLFGLGGADTFVYDTPLGPNNVDTLADFVSGEDFIHLDNAVFAGMAPGALSAAAFFGGTAATTAGHRVIYDSANGRLLFDADGNGAALAVEFAAVSPGLPVAFSDFFVV
ncbi:calcium-binding protein [Mesorhizobium sp. LHD-90]|uniref:calcium-binding protein n=1 Tax=Mesorhizobium sp. LHD-90 TaxID=3071414 RepID=UPI0027DFFC08|nr:calcium-binding protein [Mesorhizobium sp. LHD-90]MDQ6434030.1 calcium-binding protein [Mesorhizobium sp. LHD-90]